MTKCDFSILLNITKIYEIFIFNKSQNFLNGSFLNVSLDSEKDSALNITFYQCFTDLSKAFDYLSYYVLMAKLNVCGFSWQHCD